MAGTVDDEAAYRAHWRAQHPHALEIDDSKDLAYQIQKAFQDLQNWVEMMADCEPPQTVWDEYRRLARVYLGLLGKRTAQRAEIEATRNPQT